MFSAIVIFLFACWAVLTSSQSAGTYQEEVHSNITWESCSTESGCTAKKSKIVLDANWRWVHKINGSVNCISGNQWDEKLCPNNTECTKNCQIDGAGPYKRSYGITTNASALQLNYWTPVDFSENYSSRVFLLGENNTYEMFKLVPNKEFAFDVDVSALPCGINGGLNFVAMDADGGAARNADITVGANYGTGYCDALCPRNLRWINGQTNAESWSPSETDPVNGVGNYGSCCADMRIWDANSMATALTARPCNITEQHRCFAQVCGGPTGDWYGKTCDPDGCSINPYRLGQTSFYGRNTLNDTAGVDTKKKFTVVTQFIGIGEDLEIKRFYVQDGKKLMSPDSQIPGLEGASLTSRFCEQQKGVFAERYVFQDKGGMARMYSALERGMVLAMSILDDHDSHMVWLDSAWPLNREPSDPGVVRGSCDVKSGDPLARDMRSAKVVFSNIKFGPLGSTSTIS